MQRFLNVVRRLLYPAAALFLFWAGYLIMASPYISDSSGKILAVYNGDWTIQACGDILRDRITPNKENESEEAVTGFCKAKLAEGSPEVEFVNVHSEGSDGTGARSSATYQRMASTVAHGSVLAVISFLTSPDSLAVVRFCRAMQIPLLLTIAANDDLMARSEDTRGIAFRMIPTNGVQAEDMAQWLREQVPAKGMHLAMFHEPNTFGEFLHRQLSHELQPQLRSGKVITYEFEVTEHLQFRDLMPQLWCEEIDTVVYLGFAPRALDLLNQLASYKADPDQVPCPAGGRSRSFKRNVTVMLSSGAYQDDLNNPKKYTFQFEVFAMLPTSPNRDREANPAVPGVEDEEATDAWLYGYDSFQVLRRLATDRFKLPSLEQIEHSKTRHKFSFDDTGELTRDNRYHFYRLACSVTSS